MPYLAQGNRSSAGSFEKLTEEVHNQCVDMVSFYNCLSGCVIFIVFPSNLP